MHEDVKNIRHHIHSNPELSFHEEKTAAFISSKLSEFGIEHQTNIGGFGIVGSIKGMLSGNKVVALRADMDALPITEKNEVEYKSKVNGIMHACGHDVHSASLLGTAKILNQLKANFGGTVKLIFQPAEEKLPGGASIMIKDGVLENPKPDLIIGQHVFPNMQAGKAGFRSGQYMASADEIYVTVKGKGGHAAIPKEYVNPLMAAAHFLVAIESLSQSFKNSRSPVVLAFGKITGLGATNVIPDEVKIDGTLRCMDELQRFKIWEEMTSIGKSVSENCEGITIDVKIDKGYPSLFNNEEVTSLAEKAAKEYLGDMNVEHLDLRMAAEDFSFYSQLLPATFYRIGTGNAEKGITSSVHTPFFNIDEDALSISTGLMSYITIKALE